MHDEFAKYVLQYDIHNENIHLKYIHSIRVCEISVAIGKSLGLDEETLAIVELIGLLHDIGRFEQWQQHKTFADAETGDHGVLGVDVLFKDGLIRRFIVDSKYDDIIRLAILHHNDVRLPEGLDEETAMFCRIVRDADKIDILRQKAEDEIEFDDRRRITPIVYQKFMAGQPILIDDVEEKSRYDAVTLWIALIYDLNYEYSFQCIKDKGYIDKLLDKLSKNVDAKEAVDKMRVKAHAHIAKNIKEGKENGKTI